MCRRYLGADCLVGTTCHRKNGSKTGLRDHHGGERQPRTPWIGPRPHCLSFYTIVWTSLAWTSPSSFPPWGCRPPIPKTKRCGALFVEPITLITLISTESTLIASPQRPSFP